MSKTWKSAVKRIKITKRKKLFKKSAGQNHFNKPKERGKTVRAKRSMKRVAAFVGKTLH
jgi:ribosomal protein L35